MLSGRVSLTQQNTKVSHTDVMEYAMRMSEEGRNMRWQPLYDATKEGVIAWVRAGYLKELHKRGLPHAKTSRC